MRGKIGILNMPCGKRHVHVGIVPDVKQIIINRSDVATSFSKKHEVKSLFQKHCKECLDMH